ncbi:MAG: VWA domain-containing protein [Terrimicrobiaceae bacterium]
MKFVYPHALWLLPCLLLGGYALLHWSRRLARRKLALFGPPERLPRILHSVDHRARTRKYWLVTAALCLAALAIARPVFGPRSNDGKQTGAEFFLILDISKSMLVRDVAPNRLEAVRATLSKWLKTRGGDRIGLILMAGDAFVQAPLTHDLTALRTVLEQAGPHSVSRGGSHLAGAIETAANALEKSGVKNKTAVLISDGGATEGQALEALQKARANGRMTLHTVGVGTSEGGPVPAPVPRGQKEDFTKPPAGFVADEYGVRATSRLDERSLRLLAGAGGGRYFAFDPEGEIWNRLYTQVLQPQARRMDAGNLKDYTDLFQIPLLLAFALLIYQSAIPDRLKNPPLPKLAVTLPPEGPAPTATNMKANLRKNGRRPVPAALLLVLCLLAPATGRAETKLLTAEEAEKWVREGKAADAAKSLLEAAQKHPDDYYLIYNFGIASYAAGNFNEAVGAFSEAALSKDEKLHTLALTQLGNAQYRMGEAFRKANNEGGTTVAWTRAVESYESSLKDRGDSATRHNLGLAKKQLEEVLIGGADGNLKLATGLPEDNLIGRAVHSTRAIEKLEQAAQLNPGNKSTPEKLEKARAFLSETLARQARLDRAGALKVAADPKQAGYKDTLNLKASENYEKAIELAPANNALAAEHAEFKKAVANDFSDSAEALLKQSADLSANLPVGKQPDMKKQEGLLTQAVARADQGLAFDEKNARAQALRDKAQAELEKTLEARGDANREAADKAAGTSASLGQQQKAAETAGKAGDAANAKRVSEEYAQRAAGAYGAATEDYRKALALAPDNAPLQAKLAETEGKLASALAKAAEVEMARAENVPASPGGQPEPGKLQEAIGHLEKAVAMLDQSEALAPGKNDAAALGEKANSQLAATRGKLDKALGKNQNGTAQNNPGKGEEKGAGEGKDSPPKPGEGGPPLAGGTAPLNFSDIRNPGNEKQGQFVDKSKRERIRDW